MRPERAGEAPRGLWIGPRRRPGGRLDEDPGEGEEPAIAALVAQAEAIEGPLWLGGGEPCLRGDLPAVLRALAGRAPGLRTDGLALADPQVLRGLQEAGLRALRVPLHSHRPEAHDWLLGRPGAARLAMKALRLASEAGLRVEGELTLTRPTMDHLPQTVALLARLGARRVLLRRLRARGPAAAAFITLSARLGLAEPALAAAARVAWTEGVDLDFEGLPACVLPPRERVVTPTRWSRPDQPAPLPEAVAPGCLDCPGPPACPGGPADYLACFGRGELDDGCRRFAAQDPAPAIEPGAAAAPPASPGSPTPPPPRAGRAPATRLGFVRAQLARAPLRGDPLAGVPLRPVPAELRLSFAADEPTRGLRQRLCRLAQEGAASLRIEGPESMAHPAIAELLQESLRLGFPEVRARGGLERLAAASDRDLIGLRGESRLVLEVPERPEEQPRAARLARLARAEIHWLPLDSAEFTV